MQTRMSLSLKQPGSEIETQLGSCSISEGVVLAVGHPVIYEGGKLRKAQAHNATHIVVSIEHAKIVVKPAQPRGSRPKPAGCGQGGHPQRNVRR